MSIAIHHRGEAGRDERGDDPSGQAVAKPCDEITRGQGPPDDQELAD
jgi:hypothetical protein